MNPTIELLKSHRSIRKFTEGKISPNLLNVNALDESQRGADGEDSAQANTFALTVKQGSPRGDDEEAGQ